MKLHKSIALLLSLALLLSMVPAVAFPAQAASSGTCGTNLTWTLDDAGTLTISGTGAMTNYSSYSSVPWYSRRTSIKNVVIDEGVTSIGDRAFFNCTGLEEINFNATAMEDLYSSNNVFAYAGQNGNGITVNIGANVTKIPAYLFYPYSSSYYAPKIETVNFAEGSVCASIGDYAFYYCASLTGITIPDSVTSISSFAFYYCSSLNSIQVEEGNTVYHSTGNCLIETAGKTLILGCNTSQIPQDGSVTSIGSSAFSGCTGLTSITIPDSVTSIGNSAFRDCTGLTSITIPDSVTSIGSYAFSGCTGLTGITIPDSVTSIGSSAFSGCKGLEEINFNATAMKDLSSYNYVFSCAGQNGNGITVNIGANVTKIPAYLFYPYSNSSYAPKITTVNFAEGSGCTSIGESAFDGCTSLTSITIPDSVTSIGDEAFYNCTGLTYNIYDNGKYLGNSNNPYVVIMDTASTDITVCTIHEDTKIIGSYAFSGCTGLTSVTIGDSVTSIGEDAFRDCTGLTSVTIGDGVTSIGYGAFRNCTGLTDVTIPDSVTSIENYAFSGCTGLTSITIGDSVTSIGDSAFQNCTGLTVVNYNAVLVADIAYRSDVFANIGKNTSGVTVNIGAKVQRIPAYLFHYHDQWNSSDDNYVKQNIKTVNFAEGSVCKSIGKNAFYGSTVLTSVNITDISAWCMISFDGSYANPLYYAKNLYLNNELVTDLVIPDSVTSIGDNAFNNCTSLTSVSVGNSVSNIGTSAFRNCTGLTSVSVGDSVTSIGEYAFYDCKNLLGIAIPADVTSVGDSAFNNCISMAYVLYGGTVDQRVAITMGSDNSSLTGATWHYSVERIDFCNQQCFYCPDCEASYNIKCEKVKATVTFLAEDGTVISSGKYSYKQPVIVPAAPTKAADKIYTYPFAGWDKEVSAACIGDATYTATYTPTYIEYTVEFKDWDGSTLSSKTYHYGDVVELPAISGRPADETYTYVFTGWDKTVVNCDGDAVYTAHYTPVYINYTVTFEDWDGTVLSEKTYHYGDTITVPTDPTRADDGYLSYQFIGWTPNVTSCAGDATYTATYNATYTESAQLQQALESAAANGGTVKLVKDTQVSYLTVDEGVALDLNGHTLTVKYLTCFGTVVDGTIGGNALVIVNKGIHVAGDNSFMPIYDTAAGGYRFYKYELQNLGFKAVDSGTVKAGFRLTFANTSGYDVLSTTTDVALDTVALVSWTGSMGVTHYTFGDDTLRNYAALAAADMANKGTVTKAITLTLTGVDSLGANPTVNFQPTVATAPGMTAKAPEAKWTAQ